MKAKIRSITLLFALFLLTHVDALANSNRVSWSAPKHWQTREASGMRQASFSVPNANGAAADVSIVTLGGFAGGEASNINRWRRQLGLPPMSESEIAKDLKSDKSPAGKFKWTLIEPSTKGGEAILGAMLPLENRTLFVKAKGDLALLRSEQKHFLSLVRSLKR
jgi:hypothetical protein